MGLSPNRLHLRHSSSWQEKKRRREDEATDAASAQLTVLAVSVSCSQTTNWHRGQAGTCALICVFARLESLFVQLLPFFLKYVQDGNLSGINLIMKSVPCPLLAVANTCMIELLHL